MIAPLFSCPARAFERAPDPPFDSSSFTSAYLSLMRGVEERVGLMVLTGGPGCGKTTLLRTIQNALAQCRGLVFYRVLPLETFEGLVNSLLRELGLTPSSSSPEVRLKALGDFLGARIAPSVLLVDDIHWAPNQTLIGLARLAMFRRGDLQVILAGEPELEERLRKPKLDWLAAEVGEAVRLDPLLRDEVAGYVVHRLAAARPPLSIRLPRNPFTPEAMNQLLRYSDGVPSTLNRLCGCALSGKPKRVDAAGVDQAAFECGLASSSTSLPVAGVKPVATAPPNSRGRRARGSAAVVTQRRPLLIKYVAAAGIAAGIGAGIAYQLHSGPDLNIRFAFTTAPHDPPARAVATVLVAERAIVDTAAGGAADFPAALTEPDEAPPAMRYLASASAWAAVTSAAMGLHPESHQETAVDFAAADSAGLQSVAAPPAPVESTHEQVESPAPENREAEGEPSAQAAPESETSAAQDHAEDQPASSSEAAPSEPATELSQPAQPELDTRSGQSDPPESDAAPRPAESPEPQTPIVHETPRQDVDQGDTTSASAHAAVDDAPHVRRGDDEIFGGKIVATVDPEPVRNAGPDAPAPWEWPGTMAEPPSSSEAIELRATAPMVRAAPSRPSLDSEQLMARGNALMQLKDPASARLFFERAAAQGQPGALSAVGRTFDPIELNRLGVIGSAGNADRALQWYRRAAASGEPGSRELVARLEERMARRQQ